MNRRNTVSAWLEPATSWLAGVLAALLLVLAVGSGAHREHDAHADKHGHHDCAVCMMAHGGVLANGAVGAFIVFSTSSFDLPSLKESHPVFACDLRLAQGRAPPA